MDKDMIEKMGDDLEKILQIRERQHKERQWKHEERMERLKRGEHEDSDVDQLEGGARGLMLNNQ